MNMAFTQMLDQATPVNDWLSPKRQLSFKQLQQTPWPTRKTEAWKYTSLDAIAHSAFTRAAEATDPQHLTLERIPGLDSVDVMVIDGGVATVSETLPAGLTITPLAEASQEEQAWGFELFANAKPNHHYFGLVNDALASAGVLIDIEADCKLERPIRLIKVVTQGQQSHCRHLVRLAKGAQATVIEQTVGDTPSFHTQVVEYQIAEHASLEHYLLALSTGDTLNVSGSHFNLSDHSRLDSTLIGFGSALSRVDIDINHRGEQAQAKFNGIYLLDGDEHFDLHSSIEHIAANSTTEETIRGVVAGKAQAVFNGRIHIHRGAQKTLAELNNRNLLLSREAEVATKPELEIYADDVRCSHGATIAEIDRSALYYLCSRGMDRSQALLALNFGFINELLDQLANRPLASWLKPQLTERFIRMNADD